MRTDNESLEELRTALTVVANSEHVSVECENANHHHLQEFLGEILDDLHECDFQGKRIDYEDGSYETECVHATCPYCDYVEAEL